MPRVLPCSACVSLLGCGIGSGRDRIATPHRPLRSPCSHASHRCDVTKDASCGSRSNSAKVARAQDLRLPQDLGTPQDLRTLQDSRTSSGPGDPSGPPHDLLKTPSGPQDHLRAPQYPLGNLRTLEPSQDCSGCPHIPKLPSVPCPMVASPFWQSPPPPPCLGQSPSGKDCGCAVWVPGLTRPSDWRCGVPGGPAVPSWMQGEEGTRGSRGKISEGVLKGSAESKIRSTG